MDKSGRPSARLRSLPEEFAAMTGKVFKRESVDTSYSTYTYLQDGGQSANFVTERAESFFNNAVLNHFSGSQFRSRPVCTGILEELGFGYLHSVQLKKGVEGRERTLNLRI